MRSKWIVLFCSLLLTSALWGCGSGGGSGGSDVGGGGGGGGATEPALIGSTACQQCHASAHTDASAVNRTEATVGDQTGIDLLVEHLAIDETIFSVLHDCEDCHGGGQFHANGPTGNPIPVRQPRAADCAECHNQISEVFAQDSHIVQVGGTDQTACSACHTPLTLEVSIDCMSCHGDPAIVDPENSPISAKVTVSKHADNSYPTYREGTSRCQMCHTTEGFLAFAETGAGDANQNHLLDTIEALPVFATDGVTPIIHDTACAACHAPHGGQREIAGWDPNANGIADQFDLCTGCHTYYSQDGTLIGSGSVASATAPYYHDTSWYRIIATTHYDNPDTGYDLAENAIEGYALRINSENPCFDCHGHELRTNTRYHLEDPAGGADYGPTIHTDWANSRHGGELLKAKVEAAALASTGTEEVDDVMTAGRFDEEGHGWSWTHYNWDKTLDGATPRSGRADCQRCHTSTGVSNFLGSPTTYTSTNNDFGHLVDWNATDGSPQNEMLYCWGCHVSVDTGELRDPGALTINYSNNASVGFPDSAASNVCIACHSGRENGDSIKNDTDADGVRSFLNSHYLTAGGLLFAEGGYEYTGEDYAFSTDDRHQNIGYGSGTLTGDVNFDAISNDYTSGPCVTCHFDSSDVDGLDRSHTLSPFTETATEGLVLNEVCVVCHTSRGIGDAANTWYGVDFEEADFVAGVVAPHKGRMLGAELALQTVLATNGILTDFSEYPYFFADSGYGGGVAGNGILDPGEVNRLNGFTDWASVYGLDQWKNVMGAAFNLNLVAHDPGATAHNRRYARRLIYDSIDFMDDGIMNDTTNATVTAQAQPYTASALSYVGSRP